MLKKSAFSKINGLCIIVKDLDKAVESYSNIFGLGPFRPMPEVITIIERRAYGKKLEGVKHATKVCKWGDLVIQIVQPIEGPSIEVEWAKKHGPGLMHVDFFVEDMDAARTEALGKGFEIISDGELENDGCFAFLKSKKINDIAPYFELIKWPKGSGFENLR